MKILIIRHADPDYSIDSLTEQGRTEAELLSRMLCKKEFKEIYVSPLGRARDTAAYTLEKLGREAVICDWLREFSPAVKRPDRDSRGVAWDWLPQDWTVIDDFYSLDRWKEVPAMADAGVKEEYLRVATGLDGIIEKHGYVREGRFYRAVDANTDTIALFCHFGVECVLLSHLLGISPMPLWQGFCAAPSSVTTLITEERRKGIASFRTAAFGDTSHLYAGGEKPSFSARFCETYDNFDERHD